MALSDKKEIKGSEINAPVTQGNDNNITINNYPESSLSSKKGFASTKIGGVVFDPYLFRKVVISVCDQLKGDDVPIEDFKFIDISEKNRLNGLSKEFYDNFIASEVEPYANQFDEFLKSRRNEDLQKGVQRAIRSLDRSIFVQRHEFNSFDQLLEHLTKTIVESDFKQLQDKEEEVFFFLCYLYLSCYIGRKTAKEK